MLRVTMVHDSTKDRRARDRHSDFVEMPTKSTLKTFGNVLCANAGLKSQIL